MNAYELADQLDNVKYQNGAKPFEMYATMLRQQADRIAELEKDLHMVQRHYDQLNLPDGYVVVCVHCAKELKIEFDEFQVLTDNEILQIYADVDGGGIIKFARAVESRLSAKIAKYEEVLNAIANDYHELSDHKIEVQVRNHKKWAREALNIEFDDHKEPFIWMDDCGTWFTNEAYQDLDNDLKDGLFPLYK